MQDYGELTRLQEQFEIRELRLQLEHVQEMQALAEAAHEAAEERVESLQRQNAYLESFLSRLNDSVEGLAAPDDANAEGAAPYRVIEDPYHEFGAPGAADVPPTKLHEHGVLLELLEAALPTAATTQERRRNEECTTVLIQNIPPRTTRDELLQSFPADGSYDFLFMPFNKEQRRTSGFVVINFVAPALAEEFRAAYEGFPLPNTTRPCRNLTMRFAKVQGLRANLDHAIQRGVLDIQNETHLPLIFLTSPEAWSLHSLAPHAEVATTEGAPPQLDIRQVVLAETRWQ